MSSFPEAATRLSFWEKGATKPLFSAPVNDVEFLCQARLIPLM